MNTATGPMIWFQLRWFLAVNLSGSIPSVLAMKMSTNCCGAQITPGAGNIMALTFLGTPRFHASSTSSSSLLSWTCTRGSGRLCTLTLASAASPSNISSCSRPAGGCGCGCGCAQDPCTTSSGSCNPGAGLDATSGGSWLAAKVCSSWHASSGLSPMDTRCWPRGSGFGYKRGPNGSGSPAG